MKMSAGDVNPVTRAATTTSVSTRFTGNSFGRRSAVCSALKAGSTTGAVQLFDFPLSLPGKWREWKLHGDQVNFIKISHTNDILVTASLDGSFAIWDIKMLEDKTKEVEPYTFAVEILITKSELEEKNNLIEDLKQKVDESKTECAYQLRLKVTFDTSNCVLLSIHLLLSG